MKTKTFSIAVFVLFISLLSLNSLAQNISKGAAAGEPDGEVSFQPAPESFKRNNGNSTCGGQAVIRVAFPLIPDFWPVIEELKAGERRVEGVIIDNIDASELASKGYVSYCIHSPNIPPAAKLSIKFHYLQTNQAFWMEERF
jgi:hypothetical protein